MGPPRALVASRAPSIFSARWFELLLGGLGVLLITVLVVPYLVVRGMGPVTSAVVLEPSSAREAVPPTPDTGAQPAVPATPVVPAGAGEPAAPGAGAYRIQVGAFAEPADAERLATRLAGEGLAVSRETVREPRWRYRLFVGAQDDGPALRERLRAFGLEPEPRAEGVGVGGLLPLRRAVERSRQLAALGFEVRLARETTEVARHLVEVGGFQTREAAERARRGLAARGLDGVVVPEEP